MKFIIDEFVAYLRRMWPFKKKIHKINVNGISPQTLQKLINAEKQLQSLSDMMGDMLKNKPHDFSLDESEYKEKYIDFSLDESEYKEKSISKKEKLTRN